MSYEHLQSGLQNVDNDRVTRWRPSERVVKNAKLFLAENPQLDLVVIPLVQPGKVSGVWTMGQEVETVEVYLPAYKMAFADEHLGHSLTWARNEAWEIARRQLGDREGTTAYACVNRENDNVPVFED